MMCVLAFLVIGAFSSSISADETFRGGIVYGPRAAFNISAPDGWVLDNKSVVELGQPCLIYRKGGSWPDVRTVIYAKIAGTQFEDVNAFVAKAISEMQKTHEKPREKIASGKTGDGRDYFINEYPATKTYSRWERVGYVHAARRRLHRSLLARSCELPERFSHPPAGAQDLCVSALCR